MELLQLLSLLMGLLATAPSGAESRLVEQSPAYLMLQPGESQSVICTLKDTNYPWMSWYLQDAQGKLHFLVQSGSKGDPENTSWMEISYQSERVNNTQFILKMQNVTQSQTIYCTCSKSPDSKDTQQYFGQGTRLTVLEDGLKITAPTVAIFPPSKQEINDKKKATLVCLATDFYPDHIKLVWKVNGEERKEGVNTEESVRDESSKRYSLTSRLRVSSQEWFNSKIVFKCSVDFYTNMTQIYAKEIRGGTDCSVSEESYLRSAIAGKSVYILLIFKSALYGFFVMGLVLRNKQVH